MNAQQRFEQMCAAMIDAPWADFMSGYNSCIKGADLADMKTPDEIEGWWYARKPHAANDVTVDADFIRHGGA